MRRTSLKYNLTFLTLVWRVCETSWFRVDFEAAFALFVLDNVYIIIIDCCIIFYFVINDNDVIITRDRLFSFWIIRGTFLREKWHRHQSRWLPHTLKITASFADETARVLRSLGWEDLPFCNLIPWLEVLVWWLDEGSLLMFFSNRTCLKRRWTTNNGSMRFKQRQKGWQDKDPPFLVVVLTFKGLFRYSSPSVLLILLRSWWGCCCWTIALSTCFHLNNMRTVMTGMMNHWRMKTWRCNVWKRATSQEMNVHDCHDCNDWNDWNGRSFFLMCNVHSRLDIEVVMRSALESFMTKKIL